MNATEKYLFQAQLDFLRDTEALTDADLSAMLGVEGGQANPSRRNPNKLTAAGFADLLGVIVERSNRRLAAAAEVFGLNLARMLLTAEAAEQGGAVDRVTANAEALERELARRGPTARRLTKWILTNAEIFKNRMAAEGLDREQMADAMAAYFEGDNAAGKSNPEYARAILQYFDQAREALDTDIKLTACCYLFRLDHESVVERAAILEYDAGIPRTTAAMRAVWFALQDIQSALSEQAAMALFDIASVALDYGIENEWSRKQIIAWLAEYIGEPVGGAVLPASCRRAG